MSLLPALSMTAADWWMLFAHYLVFSLLAVGGAVPTAPEMHRYIVDQQHWLTDAQFTASIAIAQAAPGPNLLFVALLGWSIGINAGGVPLALLGVLITMTGMLLPSATLTYLAARWGHDNRELRAVRAFKQGMAPMVAALLAATGWILASALGQPGPAGPLWLLVIAAAVLVFKTRLHILWLLAAGGLLGWLGWV